MRTKGQTSQKQLRTGHWGYVHQTGDVLGGDRTLIPQQIMSTIQGYLNKGILKIAAVGQIQKLEMLRAITQHCLRQDEPRDSWKKKRKTKQRSARGFKNARAHTLGERESGKPEYGPLNWNEDVWKTKRDTWERSFPRELSAERRCFTEQLATREEAFKKQPCFKREAPKPSSLKSRRNVKRSSWEARRRGAGWRRLESAKGAKEWEILEEQEKPQRQSSH